MKTIELYEFNELNEDAKAYAIDKYRYQFSEYDAEYLTEWFESELYNAYGLEDVEVLWSLSHSQGDGVSFTGEISEDALSIILKAYDPIVYDRFQAFKRRYDTVINIDIRRVNYRYYHEYSATIDIDADSDVYNEDDVTSDIDTLEALMDDVSTTIERAYIDICQTLKREGYDYISNVESDENTIEDLLIGGCLFYENGVQAPVFK